MSNEFVEVPKMILNRSDYVLAALYQWMIENDGEPQIVVNTLVDGVFAPSNLINPDGTIVYNLTPTAISGLSIKDGYVCFSARFNGKETYVSLPCVSVLVIFDRVSQIAEQVNSPEQQQFIIDNGGARQTAPVAPPPKQEGKSFLRVVK